MEFTCDDTAEPWVCLCQAREALAQQRPQDSFACAWRAVELLAVNRLSQCPVCSPKDTARENIDLLTRHKHISEQQCKRLHAFRQVRNSLTHANLEPSVFWAHRVLEEITELCAHLGATVSDIMSAPAISAAPEDGLGEFIRRVRDEGISQFPVVSGGDIVGTLDEACLFRAALDSDRAPISELTVRDVMIDQALPVVAASAPIHDCRAQLIDEGAVALLVIDDERIVGIVTKHDLLKRLPLSPAQVA